MSQSGEKWSDMLFQRSLTESGVEPPPDHTTEIVTDLLARSRFQEFGRLDSWVTSILAKTELDSTVAQELYQSINSDPDYQDYLKLKPSWENFRATLRDFKIQGSQIMETKEVTEITQLLEEIINEIVSKADQYYRIRVGGEESSSPRIDAENYDPNFGYKVENYLTEKTGSRTDVHNKLVLALAKWHRIILGPIDDYDRKNLSKVKSLVDLGFQVDPEKIYPPKNIISGALAETRRGDNVRLYCGMIGEWAVNLIYGLRLDLIKEVITESIKNQKRAGKTEP